MPADEKKSDQVQTPAESNKRKQTIVMIAAVAAIMLLEAGGIFLAVRFFGGGPAPAEAVGLVEKPITELSDDVEVPVVKFKAPNMKTGKLFLYDIEVYARVKKDRAEELTKILETYKATVEDRLARVIRSADPQDLREDGLETLRRQIKHELSQIVGDEKMIEEILIPRCTPFRADY